MMVVIVKDNGRLVERVDPRTRKVTGEPQQFSIAPDDRGYALQILAKEHWIDAPQLIEVQSMHGFSIPPQRTGDEPV